MYWACFVIGAVLALLFRRAVCDAVSTDCFTFTVQHVPISVLALVGLVYWLWRWLVLDAMAKRTGQSAEELGRNSSSPIRKLCLCASALALGWWFGSIGHAVFIRR